MCEYCSLDATSCTHPICSQGGSACACSLSGPSRCPTCGHECTPWYFGLGLEDAPASVDGLLGGAGSESPGYDRYPATKTELLSALREEIEESGEPNSADVDWLNQRLPDGTYRDPGEVFSAVQAPITMPRLGVPNWFAPARMQAIPIGARLVVAPGGQALLVGRDRSGYDVFPPGEHRLTRETAPLAAARSRPPAPGFTRVVLECSVTFFSTEEQEAAFGYRGPTKSGEAIYLNSKVRFALSDPKKFAVSKAGLSYSTPAPPDQTLSRIVTPEMTAAVRSHDLAALSADPKIADGIIRRALEDAGFAVRDVRVEYVGSNPVGAMMAGGAQTNPFAQLPPEARAMIQARMAEAMRHPRAAGAPTPPASAGPQVPKVSAGPAGAALRSCLACGAPNPPTGKFCRNCGRALAGPRTCPACGKEVPPPVKFCGECGHRMDP